MECVAHCGLDPIEVAELRDLCGFAPVAGQMTPNRLTNLYSVCRGARSATFCRPGATIGILLAKAGFVLEQQLELFIRMGALEISQLVRQLIF
jgi:hypothetical protein